MSRTAATFIAISALVGCSGADEDSLGVYAGPPSVSEVLPGVAVSGGALYAVGENLATEDGQVVDTRCPPSTPSSMA